MRRAVAAAILAVAAATAGPVSRNVALICTWTWACARPPRGPSEHANSAGYRVIARAFGQADLS
jgi:hypothetical protein